MSKNIRQSRKSNVVSRLKAKLYIDSRIRWFSEGYHIVEKGKGKKRNEKRWKSKFMEGDFFKGFGFLKKWK
jgi:hypothetical protein